MYDDHHSEVNKPDHYHRLWPLQNMMPIMQKADFAADGDRILGYSQASKAHNRERILSQAARQIRQQGLESVSVGKLMKSVNLTHGGFYGHFASRSDLLAQALEQALSDGEAQARTTTAPGQRRTFGAMVKGYLSRKHRDSRDSGCAIAALASDVGRADQHSRQVMERHIEDFIDAVTQTAGADNDQLALVAVSAMVGALSLSRVVTDPARSDAILRAVKEHLLTLGQAATG